MLADSANKFKNSSNALKRDMRCRYYKFICMIASIVIIIVGSIVGVYVHNNQQQNGR